MPGLKTRCVPRPEWGEFWGENLLQSATLESSRYDRGLPKHRVNTTDCRISAAPRPGFQSVGRGFESHCGHSTGLAAPSARNARIVTQSSGSAGRGHSQPATRNRVTRPHRGLDVPLATFDGLTQCGVILEPRLSRCQAMVDDGQAIIAGRVAEELRPSDS